MKEKKRREVYDLMQGDEPVAELHLIRVGGASAMPAAMERGEIQIGFGGVAAVAFFRDKGKPFRNIAPLQTQGDMLMVRKELPVTDWESFVKFAKEAGRPIKIGYKGPVAVSKLIFMAACADEGLLYKSTEGESTVTEGKRPMIELVNLLDEKNTLPSLAAGIVDGSVVNQPEVSQTVHKGIARIVADLSCLPPQGQWIDHPCCSISAPDDFVAANRDTVKLFLKLMHFATARINADKRAAGVLAAKWTKLEEQVEIESVATVKYLGEFTDAWKKGMVIWADVIQQLGKFTHELKDLDGQEYLARSCDFTLLDEILAETRAETREKEAER
jgi:NitT/TauT family transport system substrate-binding protein